MYSDLVVAETKISKTFKNRLNGGSGDFSSRGKQQQVTRKRGRQDDDKWEHDLFEDDDEPRLSSMLLAITIPLLVLLTIIECLCMYILFGC
jgi:hypothetical protein